MSVCVCNMKDIIGLPSVTINKGALYNCMVTRCPSSLSTGLRSVSKQFANVSQQSCTRDRKYCKMFANVVILNAALVFLNLSWRHIRYAKRSSRASALYLSLREHGSYSGITGQHLR